MGARDSTSQSEVHRGTDPIRKGSLILMRVVSQSHKLATLKLTNSRPVPSAPSDYGDGFEESSGGRRESC
jgi:hypothetical protein